MHVGGLSVDLNWLLQLVFTVFVIALGLLHLVKNTASKYFEVDANFEGGGGGGGDRNHAVPGISMETENCACANCGNLGTKKCSRCKSVRYCSSGCQQAHWKSTHKSECKDIAKVNSTETARTNFGIKSSGVGAKTFSGIALVPATGTSKPVKKPREVLFPYDEFVKLYNWDNPGFPPCGLLNCGNSCFANVVLQCLTYTRPLIAYLLEKGHKRECRRDDWCFLCAFQALVERASQSSHPFSPINILSRLPNIGGNLGYGRQEDAHEFMRFVIDTMQSVCLDEFGGEKAVPPSSQETTLVQHIFGGHLQSQVMCSKCNKISNQLENMMDLTVEIHGDAASLEECLDQFTAKEWLHGENMYKCDGCNDYVKAWKRLTIRQAPNILTIALKRFQSGRFGKLNKRVTFPETLGLSPYMSEEGDGTDVYKLYAVVVHVDMLNASFFGHYICYTKDFRGSWYRIDDCKVMSVELEEVLSQGAYMLLYSRVSARPSYLRTKEPAKNEQPPTMKVVLESSVKENGKCFLDLESRAALCAPGSLASKRNSEVANGHFEGVGIANSESSSDVSTEAAPHEDESLAGVDPETNRDAMDVNKFNSDIRSTAMREVSGCDEAVSVACNSGTASEDPEMMNAINSYSPVPMEISSGEKDSSVAIDYEANTIEHSGNGYLLKSEPSPAFVKDVEVNGHVHPLSSTATSNGTHKREAPCRSCDEDDYDDDDDDENEAKRVEVTKHYW